MFGSLALPGVSETFKFTGLLERQVEQRPPKDTPPGYPFPSLSSRQPIPTLPTTSESTPTPRTLTNFARDDDGAPAQGPLAEKSSPARRLSPRSHSRCCPPPLEPPRRTVTRRGRGYLDGSDSESDGSDLVGSDSDTI